MPEWQKAVISLAACIPILILYARWIISGRLRRDFQWLRDLLWTLLHPSRAAALAELARAREIDQLEAQCRIGAYDDTGRLIARIDAELTGELTTEYEETQP